MLLRWLGRVHFPAVCQTYLFLESVVMVGTLCIECFGH